MEDKRIKLINKKLFLCLILASLFYIIGVVHTITNFDYSPSLFWAFVISFIVLCVSFIAGNFTKGYLPAYIMSTCFVFTTITCALLYNSSIILLYLTVLLAIISIYQKFSLLIYIFIVSFVGIYMGESLGVKILGWDHNQSGLVSFILFTNIVGVFLSYQQIKKDNQSKCDELIEKQKKIESTYQNVIDLSKVVSESATQLVDKAASNRNDSQLVLESINEIVNALSNQNDSICTQADSSGQIQDKLKDVQNCIHAMNSQVDSVVNITSESEAYMNSLIANTVDVNNIAKNSQLSIAELYKQVTEVQSVVDIITSVAEQTSLLSLNANIEAAKAGTFGAGFTVVASEIKKLADNTTDSVQRINTMLISLNNKTEKVNSEIESMNSAFTKQQLEIQQTSENMNKLLNSMDNLRSGLQDVIVATDDVVASNNTVTESITNLSSISEEISATIDTVGTACEGVLKLSNDTLTIAKDVDSKAKELSL